MFQRLQNMDGSDDFSTDDPHGYYDESSENDSVVNYSTSGAGNGPLTTMMSNTARLPTSYKSANAHASFAAPQGGIITDRHIFPPRPRETATTTTTSTSKADSSMAPALSSSSSGIQLQIPRPTLAEEEQERQLALAWLNRRQGMKRAQRLNEPPVDVDTCAPATTTTTTSHSDSSTRKKTFGLRSGYGGNISTSTTKGGKADDETVPTVDDNLTVGSHSIVSRTSDQTPTVSNVRRIGGGAFGNRVSPMHGSASLDHIEEGMNGGSGIGSGGSHESASEGPASLFNPKTGQGKLVIALLLVLVLAVVTITVAAVVASGGSSKNGGDDGGPIRSVVRPPGADTVNASPSGGAEVRYTMSPSLAPSLLPLPTFRPTRFDPKRPTATPTPPPPTESPTLAPSDFPTATPTLLPSGTPSAAPSTSAPTTVPTVIPTLPPTFSPTLDLSNMSFLATATANNNAGLLVSPSGSMTNDFGSAVSISANGLVMVVGAPLEDSPTGLVGAGAVHVYERDALSLTSSATNANAWRLRTTIYGDNREDALGSAVAVSSDGSVLAISEPTHDVNGDRSGQVRVYSLHQQDSSSGGGGGGGGVSSTNDYHPMPGSPLTGDAAFSYFGVSLAISADGRRIAVGAPYHSSINQGLRLNGQVKIFEYTSSPPNKDNDETEAAAPSPRWSQLGDSLEGTAYLDWFGSAVAMSTDGSMVVASAPRNTAVAGYVRVWQWSEDTLNWERVGADLTNDPDDGSIDDRFGHDLSISTTTTAARRGTVRGDGVGSDVVTVRLAIGTPLVDGAPTASATAADGEELRNSGQVTVYEWNSERANGNWRIVGAPVRAASPAAFDEFGYAVDLLEGNLLAVGVPGAEGGRGSVQLFRYQEDNSSSSSSSWQEHPSNPLIGRTVGDDFGFSVSMVRPKAGELVIAVGAKVASDEERSGYAMVYQQD